MSLGYLNLSSLQISTGLTLESMPPELTLNIFESVEETKGETLLRGALSKSLYPFYISKLYRIMDIRHTSILRAFYQAIKRNRKAGEAVEWFRIQDKENLVIVLSEEQVRNLLSYMPNLVQLYLRCPQVSEIVLEKGFAETHFKDLEFLKMNHVELGIDPLGQLLGLDGFKRLNRLGLSITPIKHGLNRIVTGKKDLFNNLDRLSIKAEVDDPVIVSFFSRINSLESLQLVSNRRFDRSLRNFNPILSIITPSLTNLHIMDTPILYMSPEREPPVHPINQVLTRFTELETLTIGARVLIGSLNLLLTLRELRELTFGWGSSVRFEHIYNYLRVLDFSSGLKVLHLYDSRPRTSTSVMDEMELWEFTSDELHLLKGEADRVGVEILQRAKF